MFLIPLTYWKICYSLKARWTTFTFTGEPEIQGTEKLKKEEILDAKIKKFLSVRRCWKKENFSPFLSVVFQCPCNNVYQQHPFFSLKSSKSKIKHILSYLHKWPSWNYWQQSPVFFLLSQGLIACSCAKAKTKTKPLFCPYWFWKYRALPCLRPPYTANLCLFCGFKYDLGSKCRYYIEI